ncbi:MAG: translation initiation factor IF-2 [Leptolyngbya sp. PLA3]|nr:MAG: translation initiation factor IF-2 [Cyanobacteria bacterium CYA]MCE7968600.1 translation initiation factor IF-2 [Leptolyngbya sp. PL-A3]
MAKRVFEIAKELGIKSKAIVDKCRAEGIPEEIIKNHMSTVSAGLEATVHDWFRAGDAGGTAVETAEKVDIDSVRVKTARRTRQQHVSDGEPEGAQHPESESFEIPGKPADAPEAAPEPETPAPLPGPAPVSVSAFPAATVSPRPEAAPAPSEVVHPPAAATVAEPVRGAPPPPPPPPPTEVARPAAIRPEPARSARQSTAAPAPMNVPTRPQVIKPAGPQLEKREAVRLSGPKVVRVEAPEPTETTRPRRGPAAPRGPGGGGAFAPAMVPEDDRGRSPRRGPGGAGSGGGPGGGAGAGKRRGPTGRHRGESEAGAGTWSEQDLAEREIRLQRAGGYLRQRRQQLRRQENERPASAAAGGGKVAIAAPFTIKDLSAATGVKGADIVKKLFLQGVIATINSGIDAEKAQEIMIDFDIELEVTEAKTAEQKVSEAFKDRERVDERPRGPVVTILGHVDHGKTSLLDKIRNANVAAGEAGGITQATSAFRVPLRIGDEDKHIVFIDTPGHEAFTSMRARGANVTDMVVLVVAADDGVMPQTIESINHAKAAHVPIIVALNKIDKPEATDGNIQRILGQLAEHGLNPTEWGGQTEVVRTSATKGVGIQDLLDMLDLQAQMLELRSDFDGPARGTVIEAKPEEGRGAVANLLIQEGKLKVGDFIVAGRAFGRVRDITDDRGNRLREAVPPMPVQISGIDELPDAGDKFYIADTLKKAEQAAAQRRDKERHEQLAQPKVTLDSLFNQMAESGIKEIKVVLKADVQGSVDVIKHEIEKIATNEVKARVLHAAVGGITESDVILAEASKAIIVGFNVIPSGKARKQAEEKGVEIRSYRVIYNITDDLRRAAEGLLAPEVREEVIGHAEVRQVFRVTKVGAVAGCYITNGVVERDALIRVTRNDIVIEHDRKLEQLKRFKDDAKEVRAGMECGMKIAGYDDIKEGDILECYKNVEVKRTL